MKTYNPRLKALIFQIVDNQLADNNPPITHETMSRLISAGYTKQEAKEKIATAVAGQIYDILHDNKPFDAVKYENTLKSIK